MIMLNIVKSPLFVAIFIALAVPAMAADENFRSGHYQSESGQELRVVLKQLSGDRYAIDITTTVPMVNNLPGCGGGVSGEVVFRANVGTLTTPNEGFLPNQPVSLANAQQCRINLRFLDAYTIRMEEISGCSYYHGASCSFSGDVVHEASGI